MKCNIESLKSKEVIDIGTGERMGFIDDAEIDIKTARITSLIIYGREKLFGLLGRESDISIPCENIKVIGDDVILIEQVEKKITYSTGEKEISFKTLFK